MAINFKERTETRKKARRLIEGVVRETDYTKQMELIYQEDDIKVLKEAVLIFRNEYMKEA